MVDTGEDGWDGQLPRDVTLLFRGREVPEHRLYPDRAAVLIGCRVPSLYKSLQRIWQWIDVKVTRPQWTTQRQSIAGQLGGSELFTKSGDVRKGCYA